MDPLFYLAIVILILLVIVFVVSYVLNKRTPIPKGCEATKITDEFCLQCGNEECKIHEKLDLKKIQQEIDEASEEEEHD